jgi:putative transcriptional regulator
MVSRSRKSGRTKASSRDFLTGQLLIALPNMGDPRFERSVLLICAHDESHAMGIIVNKPLADVEMGELLEQLDIAPPDNIGRRPVYFGGPVQTDRGLVLHSLDYRLDRTMEVCPGVGLTATREILVDIADKGGLRAPPARFILAIGYAGWDAGQLEEEIAVNAWAHCDADEAIVFTSDASAAWTKALARLGVTAAMLSPEWSSPRPDDAPLN